MRLARLATTASTLPATAGHWLARARLAGAGLPLEVQPVLVGLCVLPRPPVLLLLGVIVALQDLLLESAGTLVKYCEELLSKTLYLLYVCCRVDIRVPWFARN